MATAIFLLPLLILASTHRGAAQPAPLVPGARDFLQAHNQARAAVGVGPLKWSPDLANTTSLLVRLQRNQKGCQFANLTGSKYGGNQLWASGPVTPLMAVDHWVQQKVYYNHRSNSCAPKHNECGVYTQVVWRRSVELGCAQATCVKEKASLTVCFYDPPGNVVGERPY